MKDKEKITKAKKKKGGKKSAPEVVRDDSPAEPYSPGALTAFFSGENLQTNKEGGKSKKSKKRKTDESSSGAPSGEDLFTTRGVDIAAEAAVEEPAKKKVKFDSESIQKSEESSKKSDRLAQRENHKKAALKDKMNAEERKRTVFLGNAPLDSTPRSVQTRFAKFGKVDSVRVRGVIPESEKLSKKTAFLSGRISKHQKSLIYYIKFADEAAVQAALAENGQKWGENTLKVDTCIGRKDVDNRLSVFVGNLPRDTTDDQLIEFFTENVGKVKYVRIVRDPSTAMCKGFGFVSFEEQASVPLALQVDGTEFRKRPLRITRIAKKKDLKKRSENMKMEAKKKKATNGISGNSSAAKEKTLSKVSRKAIKKKKSAPTKQRLMH